jgi:hypothetical protein
MKRPTTGLTPLVALLVLVACGNGKKDVKNADDTTDELDPIESLNKQVEEALAKSDGQPAQPTPEPQPTEPEPEEKPEPQGTGPGELLLTCEALDEEVPCDVEIQRSEDLSKVDSGKGKTSHSFTLNPGTYTVQLYYDGAVDKPNLTLQQVEIPPGATVEREVEFPMAKVTFIPVTPKGKKVGGWKLRLKLKGADNWTAENVNVHSPVHISPGLYEGQLYRGKKGKTIDIPKIQVNVDAITQQPIIVTH